MIFGRAITRPSFLFVRDLFRKQVPTFRDHALAVEIDRSPADRRIEQRGAHKRHRIGAARQAQRLSAGALHGHDLGHQFAAGGELVAHELRNVRGARKVPGSHPGRARRKSPDVSTRGPCNRRAGATLTLKRSEERVAHMLSVRFPSAVDLKFLSL